LKTFRRKSFIRFVV